MKNVVHVSRKKVLAALRKHDEMLSEDPMWREEVAGFEKLQKAEKIRRDKAYALKKALEPRSSEEGE